MPCSSNMPPGSARQQPQYLQHIFFRVNRIVVHSSCVEGDCRCLSPAVFCFGTRNIHVPRLASVESRDLHRTLRCAVVQSKLCMSGNGMAHPLQMKPRKSMRFCAPYSKGVHPFIMKTKMEWC